MPLDAEHVERAVVAALAEDLGSGGDLTTDAVVPANAVARARLIARAPLVVAGIDVAAEVFRRIDPALQFEARQRDGERAAAGAVLAEIGGRARGLLKGERTALNFLMRMCGIATTTRDAVDEVEGTGARILDTRKTVPGLRHLDKYAVTAGGGVNHRMGLYDAAMIKDTHLDAGTTIEQAVARLLAAGVPADRITVEVRTPQELPRAIAAGAGRALLDNMEPALLREAVRIGRGRIVLEASGGLKPGRLREVAETGVDYLSLGWLTHSPPAADVAMETEAPG